MESADVMDESDTIRVRVNTPANVANPRRKAFILNAINTPAPVATPFPPLKPKKGE